ncbi:MAG: sulfide/dihydroorotate dehydrogenase-like FAD/NAD-binding protein, partial [Candidatus Latescibacteria bacterium]|nr:sulfide/dihydroorotate dehydrogenase-like FAD/NAD-binding protein [Candidatus Latescibacterota bacterium]
ADADPEKGTITLVVQAVGLSTKMMSTLGPGDELLDVAGPLGKATEIETLGTVVGVGGGLGIAPLYPIVERFHDTGNTVITILGARSKSHLIYEDRMKAVSDRVLVATDDGSQGHKGFVSDSLTDLLNEGVPVDRVVAIGPVPMMQAVANVTREYDIPTVVSLNPVMLDGTGMCGGCRVSVGDDQFFACIDGPEFDGHLVDFGELANRQRMYRNDEECAVRDMDVEVGS